MPHNSYCCSSSLGVKRWGCILKDRFIFKTFGTSSLSSAVLDGEGHGSLLYGKRPFLLFLIPHKDLRQEHVFWKEARGELETLNIIPKTRPTAELPVSKLQPFEPAVPETAWK